MYPMLTSQSVLIANRDYYKFNREYHKRQKSPKSFVQLSLLKSVRCNNDQALLQFWSRISRIVRNGRHFAADSKGALMSYVGLQMKIKTKQKPFKFQQYVLLDSSDWKTCKTLTFSVFQFGGFFCHLKFPGTVKSS